MLDQRVLQHARDVWKEFSARCAERRRNRLETMQGYLNDFWEDLVSYPLARPWRQSLDMFQEHYWEQAGMRLTPDSYQQFAAMIEEAVNDPTCYAYGPIQPDATGLPPGRRLEDVLAEAKAAQAAQAAAARPPDPTVAIVVMPEPEKSLAATVKGRNQLREFARKAALLEQQRIHCRDEEVPQYEYFLYDNLLRRARGQTPRTLQEYWTHKNHALDNALALGQDQPPHHIVNVTNASKTKSPATAGSQAVSVAPKVSGPPEPAKRPNSPATTSVPRPANADGINPDDYAAVTQETIRILGADWKNVSIDWMRRLRDAGQAIYQPTGAVLGSGSNALGVESFVRLQRKDGGIDTAHFRVVTPWLSPPYWELVGVTRGATPQQEAAKVAAREKIRHADVMRVRGAITRLQGGMFAIVGGVSGIVEGAPLLGTLEAAAGAEQAGLAGVDLATGKENRAWSARAIQAALEAAGVETGTAKFLADQGGLLAALGRATVDAAGAAHAVIETSTGYRIRLEFNPTTLSTNGLGGAKIKVTRLAPDGTEIKQIGGRYPINAKYAGKVMPAEALPANIRNKYPKGLRFTSEGFPDFTDYAIKTVKPKGLTGDSRIDTRKANAEAGLSETPEGYTWHHHENGVTMQLVPTDLHDAARHTGGSAVVRHGAK